MSATSSWLLSCLIVPLKELVPKEDWNSLEQNIVSSKMIENFKTQIPHSPYNIECSPLACRYTQNWLGPVGVSLTVTVYINIKMSHYSHTHFFQKRQPDKLVLQQCFEITDCRTRRQPDKLVLQQCCEITDCRRQPDKLVLQQCCEITDCRRTIVAKKKNKK